MSEESTTPTQGAEKRTRTAEDDMMRTRKEFASTFKWVVLVVLSLIVINTLVISVFVWVGRSEPTKTALMIRLMQISLGMLLGASCVFFGVILSWLGITSAFAVESGIHTAKMNLQSTGPGVALILGGIILIGASLYKEISYSERIRPGETQILPDGGEPDGSKYK